MGTSDVNLQLKSLSSVILLGGHHTELIDKELGDNHTNKPTCALEIRKLFNDIIGLLYGPC